MGKTDTIKERAIWVYAPTIEQRKTWESIAKTKGVSLSKWIVHVIEDSLIELDDDVKTRKDIENENKNIRKEIADLEKKFRQVNIIRDNLEKEIRKYRAEPFLTTSYRGVRTFDKELISLLKNAKSAENKNRFIDNDEILSRLGIDLLEIDSVKAIANQLSRLEEYGLLESGVKGWRWKL